MRSTRLATLTLALAVTAVAACRDQSVTAPAPNVQVPPGAQRDEAYYEDPSTIATGASFTTIPFGVPASIPEQPPVGGNAQAWNYCWNQHYSNGVSRVYDQTQRLVWDSTHSPHDTLFTGRVRATAKYYVGTYSGKPVKCILRDSLLIVRAPGPYVTSLSSPLYDFEAVDFCWGNAGDPAPNCANDDAKLTLHVELPFGRNCNLNEFGSFTESSYTEPYQLGGTPEPLYTGEPLWEVVLGAGWTIVNDHGGNESPYGAGYRSNGPAGQVPICSRYHPWTQVTPFFYSTWFGQRDGMAHWEYPVGS